MLQTVGESPLAGEMPLPMKESILHATLANDDLLLMASDISGENGLIRGNAVSLMLACSSEKELRQFYKKLAKGGKPPTP